MLKPNFSENTNKIGTKTSKADEKMKGEKLKRIRLHKPVGLPWGTV